MECPLCGSEFPLTAIEAHAADCNGDIVERAREFHDERNDSSSLVDSESDEDSEVDDTSGEEQEEEEDNDDNGDEKDQNQRVKRRIERTEDGERHSPREKKRRNLMADYARPQSRAEIDQLKADEEFARRLMEEEERSAQRRSRLQCQLCGKEITADSMFVLDECSHKFCIECIKQYALESTASSVVTPCPVAECEIPLSARDLELLLPSKEERARALKKTSGSASQQSSQRRIMEEMRNIMKSDNECFEIEVDEDDLYRWMVRFKKFDAEQIGRDLKKLRMDHILGEVRFPKDFPFHPPFVRLLRPRMQFHTGHVTIGGSVCMELLTNSGWRPQTSMEAVLLSVRDAFISGGGRIDISDSRPYTMHEAKVAYDRLVALHGWG